MKKSLDFLHSLSLHNDRAWMNANKNIYNEAKLEFETFVNTLIDGIASYDDSVAALDPRDCIFRLNRDVRFGKDKRPYKENFGAAITEGGKKAPNPTYYIHIQPGESFVAGGIYMPEAKTLRKIRQEIDYNAEALRQIVSNEYFKSIFGKMTGESLKTAPKGYPKDYPDIELLRMKSFLASRNLSDEEVLSQDCSAMVIRCFRVLYPFNQYFASAVKA